MTSETDNDEVWGKLLSDALVAPTLHSVFTREESSLIREARYVPDKKLLTVSFHSSPVGETYTYHAVPEHLGSGIFEASRNAESIGMYFSKHIKKNFAFVKRYAEERRVVTGSV